MPNPTHEVQYETFPFASGDDGRDGINTGWQSVSQTESDPNGTAKIQPACNSYNESNMMLMNRASNMQGTQADVNVINSINNKDQGVIEATVGYDATITPKVFVNTNVGVAWAAKNNAVTRAKFAGGKGDNNGTNFIGTEVNITAGYKMYDNLTASVQAAYLFLGGYYSGMATNGTTYGHDPEDPYTARVMLSYAF